jgi:hypothetical protein
MIFFLLTPMFPRVTIFFVRGVKCVLSLVGVFLNSKSLRFTNAGH